MWDRSDEEAESEKKNCRKEGRGYMMSPGGCDLTTPTRWAPAAPASQETPD